MVRARCCTTDKPIGEIALHGRGEVERARTSLNRHWYATLGTAEMTCTVTSGGGPILRIEEALSSYSSSAAAGKLTVTDFSDGEDMVFTAKFDHDCIPQ